MGEERREEGKGVERGEERREDMIRYENSKESNNFGD
jgi:hypothetical protein